MVRHDSLVFCQPPGTAPAESGPTDLWSSRTCMPRQPPHVNARQAILPQAIYQKIPDREAGHNTDTACFKPTCTDHFSEQNTQETDIYGKKHYSSPCPPRSWFLMHKG